MPIHLPPISRRQFLAGSAAAGASLLLPGASLAAQLPVDPNRWTLFADTHVCADRNRVHRDVKPFDNFIQARGEALAQNALPAGLFIAGDCAFLRGTPGDYAVLLDLLKPIRAAGVPLHLILGNHDQRENFSQAVAPTLRGAGPSPVTGKLVSVLETPLANWFSLDSLDKTAATAGELGKAQLDWLAKALDARPGKPAIVVAHHYLFYPGGLEDSDALLAVLTPRPQVKAYVFGHSHTWQRWSWRGIHLINLPAVAWVFDSVQPHAWVDMKLTASGATLAPVLAGQNAPEERRAVGVEVANGGGGGQFVRETPARCKCVSSRLRMTFRSAGAASS